MRKLSYFLFFFLLSIPLIGQDRFYYPGGEKALTKLVNKFLTVNDLKNFTDENPYSFEVSLKESGGCHYYSFVASDDRNKTAVFGDKIRYIYNYMDSWIPTKDEDEDIDEDIDTTKEIKYRITLKIKKNKINVTYKEIDPFEVYKILGLPIPGSDGDSVNYKIEIKPLGPPKKNKR